MHSINQLLNRTASSHLLIGLLKDIRLGKRFFALLQKWIVFAMHTYVPRRKWIFMICPSGLMKERRHVYLATCSFHLVVSHVF